ncbi:MAG: hypothetical protein ACMUJM_05255 [bacterium]
MHRKKRIVFIVMTLTILLIALLVAGAQADYWTAMPPYNVLWPLWSPALSPENPVTGVATPLVNAVTRHTILPVQPAMLWDPASPEANNGPLPWLAYNTPLALGGGLLIWDQYYGMRPFPPDYMVDPVTSTPVPIPLPLSYWLLRPIEFEEINAYHFVLGNLVYANTYGVPLLNLLTPQEFWGLPPLTVGVY